MESLLPELGVARASYGLPVRYEPLKAPPKRGLLKRLGATGGALASARVGDTTVHVRDRCGFREMVALAHGNELIWTRASLRDPSESGWPYIELFHLAAVQSKACRHALFVGAGGAVALRQFARVYPGLALDLVEREPAVIELARAWFDLDRIPGLKVHIADGSEFVKKAARACWDVAVIDAFDCSNPTSTLTEPAFFSALHRALRPGAGLAVNVIGTLDGHGPVRDVTRALDSGFERVRVVPVMTADEAYSPSALRNVVLIASNKA